MADPLVDLVPLERQLFDERKEIENTDANASWQSVEATARAIADGLRFRDSSLDNQTNLGKTALPQTLATLFHLALHGSSTPSERYAPVITELSRVTANLCMDHDDNRAQLLEAKFPQAIVSILEAYVEAFPRYPTPIPLSIPQLKVVRAAIGFLLNASVNYDPVKFRLISLEAAMTILKLSTAIYPTSSWLSPTSNLEAASLDETWTLRTGLSSWAWRAISELKDVKDETLQIFNPDVLPLLTPTLEAFLPANLDKTSPVVPQESPLFNTLLQADFENLEESCMLIESLSLDIEDVRLSLARGLHFPAEHGGVPCLTTILDFIEFGAYPPLWTSPGFGEVEARRKEKAFDICKAALIKSVVEVAGEERNGDVLWDDSEEDKPGGVFVSRMVQWIKRYVADMDAVSVDLPSSSSREDLVICASLSLGNLARLEKNSTALLSPPHSLAPFLTSPHLLSPDADIKMKHGIIGLLKHLAQSASQSPTVNELLGRADVVRSVSNSGVWDERTDGMAEVVQVSAIGVVKHLCNASVENTLSLVLPPDNVESNQPTGLSLIMALIRRSDSVPVKSEGTRVLVNVVKSLWSVGSGSLVSVNKNPSPTDTDATLVSKERQRLDAMGQILTPECTLALASLIARSGKYPLLVNEGIVALSLLSTQKAGAALVLEAIMTPVALEPLPQEETPSATSSDVSSPVIATPPPRGRLNVPRHAFDTMIFVLKNVDNPANYPIEVRVNTCSLVNQLVRNSSGDNLLRVQERVRPVLDRLLETHQDDILSKAARRLVDALNKR